MTRLMMMMTGSTSEQKVIHKHTFRLMTNCDKCLIDETEVDSFIFYIFRSLLLSQCF